MRERWQKEEDNKNNKMGAPKRQRKKYVFHKKKWDKGTILEEMNLVKGYALKNKKEIRKVEFQLSKIKKVSKSINTLIETEESKKNSKNLIERLKRKGYLNMEAKTLDEVLDISVRDILDRRLATILYRHKMARTTKQARQFIIHKHILVNGVCVNSPSYSVSLEEENQISFVSKSSLFNEEHPERLLAKGLMLSKEEEEVEKKIEEKKRGKEKKIEHKKEQGKEKEEKKIEKKEKVEVKE